MCVYRVNGAHLQQVIHGAVERAMLMLGPKAVGFVIRRGTDASFLEGRCAEVVLQSGKVEIYLIYLFIYLFMCDIFICIYIYVCMYVCMYVCKYTARTPPSSRGAAQRWSCRAER